MAASPRPDLTGRLAIVTGANSGLGLETAVELAAMGARVVMTARDPGRGAAAHQEVRSRSGSDDVLLEQLDLASMASVRAFAGRVLDAHPEIHVLVNNAGLMLDRRELTEDGFEVMFGVNHLGHFLLTDLLRERLVASAPARVVVVASVAHRFAIGGLRPDDLQSERRFRPMVAYGRSKLANVLFARELASQLAGTGVTVNSVHPGSIASGFGRDGDTGTIGWLMSRFGSYVLRSPSAGARTQVLLASSEDPKVAGSSGAYWYRDRAWRPSRAARDDAAARWLWERSRELVAEAT